MKIGSKRIWLVLAALVSLGVVAGIWWTAAIRAPAQYITLSNGVRYRFVGISSGTNHSQPRLLARVVDGLPNRWAAYIRAKLGPSVGLAAPIHTEPALLVWLEPVGTNAFNPYGWGMLFGIGGRLADERGVQAGSGGGAMINGRGPQGWTFLKFTVVPRRSRMLECQLQEAGARLLVKFRNPLFGHFPQWTPEPLPAVKAAGDLKVQLVGLSTTNDFTAFFLAFNSPRGTDESWTVEYAELTDATGNRLTGGFEMKYGTGSYEIPGTLWPDEPALRLKLGFKRTAGFPAEDVVTFTNLPVSPDLPSGPVSSSRTSLTNVQSGIRVVLNNFKDISVRSGPAPGPYWLNVQLPDHPPGVVADIVRIVTRNGEVVTDSNWDSVDSSSRNFKSVPNGATYLNVTVAVQKKRSVEFLVKPEGQK